MKKSFMHFPIVLVQSALPLLLFFAILSPVRAQITTGLNQQMYQEALTNPSAMGLKDDARVYINQRTDYLGGTVQPLTFTVGGNAPAFLNKRFVIGGQMSFRIQQQSNSFRVYDTESTVRVAYRLVDVENHKFSLGTSVGISSIKLTYLIKDPLIFERTVRQTRFDLGVGASYQYTKEKFGLKLGASLTNFPAAFLYNDGFFANKSAFLLSTASVSHSFGDWKVEPIVLLRTFFNDNSSNTIADLGARVHYKDIVWVGGGARTQSEGGHFEIGLKPAGKLQNRLDIFGSVSIFKYKSISLEFGLGYTFGKKAKSE